MGADFIESARAKAEEFLKELSKAGGDTQGRAQGAFDDLVGGGRKSTEQFVSTIRKEVQRQLSSLGLATKAELEALERKLSGRAAATTTSSSTATKAAPAKKAARPAAKATTATTATGGTGAAAKKAPARKSPAKKVAKKAAG